MTNTEPYFVQEFYRDPERTIFQMIMYRYGDDREKDYYRSIINIHCTELYKTLYLNESNIPLVYNNGEWKLYDFLKYKD